MVNSREEQLVMKCVADDGVNGVGASGSESGRGTGKVGKDGRDAGKAQSGASGGGGSKADVSGAADKDEHKIKAAQQAATKVAHQSLIQRMAKVVSRPAAAVETAMKLLDGGNTVPFIARYRKEMTGEMDEEVLRLLAEQMQYARQMDERRADVLQKLEEQGQLTDALRKSLLAAVKLQEIDDIYRPFRPKRRTRASVARERGLTPLAVWMWRGFVDRSPAEAAALFVNAELELADAAGALQGALDIIAEHLADDPAVRSELRAWTEKQGKLVTEKKNDEAEAVYQMYFTYEEVVRTIVPHRVLAINRGEKEEALKVKLETDAERAVAMLRRHLGRTKLALVEGEALPEALQQSGGTDAEAKEELRELFETMLTDAYKRLLAPAVERDVRNALTERAEEQAIRVFGDNLRQLLLQPPVKGRTVLGIDPAFRTGCKWAVIDDTGKLLEVGVFYPTAPFNRVVEARKVLLGLIVKYVVNLIAIGNGTASRETELFVADSIRESGSEMAYLIVNEAGASVYSASPLAKKEFPDLDVAERSAISIARRLQDPLAELVKIDPQSIGVGQYQHDVSVKRLTESLDAVVESAVNHVGVDLNTASAALLEHVSGLSSAVAKQVVLRRDEVGKFRARRELKEVPRLGAKTFEQCVGFLRINDGEQPLDRTPIHPESYPVVLRLLKSIGCKPEDAGSQELRERLMELDVPAAAAELEVGLPTLRDILDSLNRPGRDPRDELPAPLFRTDVLQMEDLKPGMELQGTVRNVIDFGAFVDIGVKQDGLVHISRLSEKFIKHPAEAVAVGDIVTVWVLSVDLDRGRIALSMRPSDAS